MRKALKKIARNDLTRIFIRNRDVCNSYVYEDCIGFNELSKTRPNISRVEVPSNTKLKKFVEDRLLLGSTERFTSSMTVRMMREHSTGFLELLESGCSFDAQIHFGECYNPLSFNEYDKVYILNDIIVSNYTTTQLLALTSSNRNIIEETVDITIGNLTTVYPVAYLNKSADYADLAEGSMVSVTTHEAFSDCEDCGCDGCNVFALQLIEGLDPCTNAGLNEPTLYLWYSSDCGETFSRIEIDCIDIRTAVDANCDGITINKAMNIKASGGLLSLTVPKGQVLYIDIPTLFNEDRLKYINYAGGLGRFNWAPYTQWFSNGETIVAGQFSNIWYVNSDGESRNLNPSLNTGTIEHLDAINPNEFIFASLSALHHYKNGQYTRISDPLTAIYPFIEFRLVKMIGANEFLTATNRGIFHSCDCGKSWTLVWSDFSTATNCIYDWDIDESGVGYMIINSPELAFVPSGKPIPIPTIYKTIDYGLSWNRLDDITQLGNLPSTFNFDPTTDYLLSIAVNKDDVNSFFAVGLRDIDLDIVDPCDIEELWDIDDTGLLIEGKRINNSDKRY